jgi:LCP family protein required for cell wall assembly
MRRLMPRTRWGVTWRGLLAMVVVVGCAAGVTATAGLLEFKDLANGFKAGGTVNVGKSQAVKLPAPGKPETLLLIGVDCRPHECKSGGGNTDTMMLLRIDDRSTTINALSIPRDLAVNIPGHGVDKLNAAYADDGSRLLLQTLRDDVFPGLLVTHILIVDFTGFAKLINEIGCVYAQVDRRYYNHSIGPADPTTNYSSIDIQPGYQKLCGGSGANLGGATSALAFVRFRHNDSDFVRQARQQDFLRWTKQNFTTGQLLSDASTLFDTFSHNVQTDPSLHSVDGIDDLIRLAINANGSTLKSIPFPDGGTETIDGGDDVILDETAAIRAYHRLMTPTKKPPAGVTTTTPTVPTTTSPGKHHQHTHAYVPPATAHMRADTGDGTSQAAHLDHPGLPVYYPEYIPDNYSYCFSLIGNCDIGYEPPAAYAASYPRHYSIVSDDGKRYPSYVMTLSYGFGGQTDTAYGDFASVQGTTWTGVGHEAGPPILRKPSAIKIVNHKLLYEYFQGGALTVVAWQKGKAVYWISNTLENNIGVRQMLAMAASFTRAR